MCCKGNFCDGVLGGIHFNFVQSAQLISHPFCATISSKQIFNSNKSNIRSFRYFRKFLLFIHNIKKAGVFGKDSCHIDKGEKLCQKELHIRGIDS